MLSRGMMKPYPFEDATDTQEYFNFKLSSSRMVTECFFGQLKSPFRCLLNGLQLRQITNNRMITSSCVLLHNFLLSNSTFFDDSLLEEDELDNRISMNRDDNDADEYYDLMTILQMKRQQMEVRRLVK